MSKDLAADLVGRLRGAELEMKTQGMALSHGSFSCNNRLQLRQLLDAIHELTTPPAPSKRPIGFVTFDDKPKGSKPARGNPSTRGKKAD